VVVNHAVSLQISAYHCYALFFIGNIQNLRQDQTNVTSQDEEPGNLNDWENEPIYEEPLPLDYLVHLCHLA